MSYNPVASAWKGNAVAQALMMHSLGVPLGLGTDGARSDEFRLLDYAEAAQRFAHGIAAGDSVCGAWLNACTQGGAKVLGLGEMTGRIARGMSADFLLIDLAVPELLPSSDLSWELVRLVNRDQIQAVVVREDLRLWQGWPTDWDAQALMRQVETLAKDVLAQAPIHKVNPSPLNR